jgi:deoxyribonuclease V
MTYLSHPWDVTPNKAIEIQDSLRHHVSEEDHIGSIESIAGVDASYQRATKLMRSAVAVLAYPSLALVDQATHAQRSPFPYIPGLLSFREVPALLSALQLLERSPDLILCDAHGRAHPRRFGLACHLGVLMDIPAIGVAKTRLIGDHEPVPDRRGAWVPLFCEDEAVGAVLRTREGAKPVFVSIGHRISLESAIEIVLDCSPHYRLPETTRVAHRLASETWR